MIKNHVKIMPLKERSGLGSCGVGWVLLLSRLPLLSRQFLWSLNDGWDVFYWIIYVQSVIVEASTDVKTKASKIIPVLCFSRFVARTLFENKVRPKTIETCFKITYICQDRVLVKFKDGFIVTDVLIHVVE